MSNDGGAVGPTDGSQGVRDMTVRGILHDDSKDTISVDRNVSVEKGELIQTHETEAEDELNAFSHEYPFPEDPNAEPELQQFTIRAVLVGCILGGVIAASKYVTRPCPCTSLTIC